MSIWQDFRFAIRLLYKDRWYTLAAIVALGLGIGANSTVFTCVNGVFLRGLPHAHADRILHVNAINRASGDQMPTSYPDFADMRAQSRTFEALGAFYTGTMNLSDDRAAPERLSGTFMTANGFEILGQPAALGRGFVAADDRPGAPPVVILSAAVWAARYGGDRSIIGRVVRINEVPATVVGIMPEGMRFPMTADAWQPLPAGPEREKRNDRSLNVFGRVRVGTTAADARAELATITARLARQYPDTNKDVGAVVMTFSERFNGGPLKVVFGALMGAVVFVLLVACANVANLLLARSAGRARELAVRVAVGASRWRLARQLLVESAIVSTLAAGVVLVLSRVGVKLFDQAVADTGKPYWIQFPLDYRVVAFLVLATAATAVLFGLAPALHAARTDVNETLKEGGRGGTGGRRARRFTGAMVVAELALTLVLLAGAGLMIRSFLALYMMDFGMPTERVLTMALMLAERKYPAASDWLSFHDRLAERLASSPGVAAWSVASDLPLGNGGARPLDIDGRPVPAGQKPPQATIVFTGPGYFATLETALLRGREFTPADARGRSQTAIVNQRFVDRFLAGADPLGARVRMRKEKGDAGPWLTVVGVSPTIRQAAVQDAEPDAVVYVPMWVEPGRFAFLLARGAADPAALTSVLRDEIRAVDADQPVFRVMTLAGSLARARWPYRVFGGLFAVFAIIALVLSAVGIYAVTSYSVAQRRQEMGIRMALGAGGMALGWLVLRRALVQVGIGLAIGLAAALGLCRVIRSLLVGQAANDLLTYAGVLSVLIVVATVASLVPAIRASRLDPLAVLRAE